MPLLDETFQLLRGDYAIAIDVDVVELGLEVEVAACFGFGDNAISVTVERFEQLRVSGGGAFFVSLFVLWARARRQGAGQEKKHQETGISASSGAS
jgi:hypothetical protein